MGLNNPIQLPADYTQCVELLLNCGHIRPWTQQDLLWTNFVIIIQLPDHITAMKTDTHFTPYHTIVI